MVLEVGERVGPLRIERELGRGAYGIVYLAHNTLVGRRVALKVLPGRDGAVTEALRAEVRSEARMLGALNSPHIVRLFRLHPTEDGGWTQEMEFLEGGSLEDRIEDDKALPFDRAVRVFRALCLALKAAHGARIIHGDIKPANVLFGGDGSVKLADFGLARKLQRGAESIDLDGEAFGSPRYMAPEVMTGQQTGPAADVWSCAVLFYRMLTGRFPFPAQFMGELVQKVLNEDPEPFGPDVPTPLAELVLRCLAKDADERLASARTVVDELDRVAAQDTRLTPVPEATERPTNWSPPTDTFVGRRAELDELDRLLGDDDARLVTVTGPGGVGKTRVAEQLCGRLLPRFPGGCWMVDLTEAADAFGIAHAVAAALGVQLAAEGDPVGHLADVLEYRDPMLVVVDNFEQVRAHAEATLGLWIARAPRLRFLVTSRVRLDLPGERRFELGPLPAPEPDSEAGRDPQEARVFAGVRLFEDRAKLANPAFALDAANTADVVRICRGLDGMPLAIELAAARMDAMTAADVAERLGEKFSLLESSRGDVAPRQRSLDRAIDWSFELLRDWEQEAFLQACYFRDTFGVDAIGPVVDLAGFPEAPDALEVAQGLRDRSLLTADLRDGTRLSMYRAIKDYGRACWEERADPERKRALARRHADYYLAVADEWNRFIPGPRDQEALDHIDLEVGNLARVLDWALEEGDAGLAARAVGAAAETMKVRRPPGQLAPMLERALEALGEERSSVGATLRTYLSETCLASGDWDRAASAAREAVAIAREIDDTRALAAALVRLGEMQRNRGQLADALASLEEGERLAAEAGMRELVARGIGGRGMVLGPRGDFDRAWECFEAAESIAHEIADHPTEALHLCNLGVICESRGLPDKALDYYRRAEEIARRIGGRLRVAVTLANQANVLVQTGETEAGLLCYREAESIARELGAKQRIAQIVVNRGVAHAYWGELKEALECYAEAESLARELGDQRQVAMALIHRGNALLKRDELVATVACYEQAEQAGRECGDRTIVARCLGLRGAVYRKLDRADDAWDVLATAVRTYDEMHANQSHPYLVFKAELAALAKERGEEGPAVRLAEEALALADQLGVGTDHPDAAISEAVERLRRIRDA
jgi:non-specific serine/threonine protein kinase